MIRDNHPRPPPRTFGATINAPQNPSTEASNGCLVADWYEIWPTATTIPVRRDVTGHQYMKPLRRLRGLRLDSVMHTLIATWVGGSDGQATATPKRDAQRVQMWEGPLRPRRPTPPQVAGAAV